MAQVALITGASTGIGRALANQFARHGYDLVLVARNGGALREVERALSGPSGEPGKARPTSVEVIPLDLAQPHAGSTLAGVNVTNSANGIIRALSGVNTVYGFYSDTATSQVRVDNGARIVLPGGAGAVTLNGGIFVDSTGTDTVLEIGATGLTIGGAGQLVTR